MNGLTKKQKINIIAMRVVAAFFILFGGIIMLVAPFGIGFVGVGIVIIMLSYAKKSDYEFDNEEARKKIEEKKQAAKAAAVAQAVEISDYSIVENQEELEK